MDILSTSIWSPQASIAVDRVLQRTALNAMPTIIKELSAVYPTLWDEYKRRDHEKGAATESVLEHSEHMSDREWRKAVFRLFDVESARFGMDVQPNFARLSSKTYPVIIFDKLRLSSLILQK